MDYDETDVKKEKKQEYIDTGTVDLYDINDDINENKELNDELMKLEKENVILNSCLYIKNYIKENACFEIGKNFDIYNYNLYIDNILEQL